MTDQTGDGLVWLR